MEIILKSKKFFFISFFLILLILSISTIQAENTITPVEMTDQEFLSSETSFSANSNIGLLIPRYWRIEKPAWWDITKLGKYPAKVKFYLRTPTNEIKYMIIDDIKLLQETSSIWDIDIGEHEIRIPFSPETGNWKIQITTYSQLGDVENKCTQITYTGFYVGESELTDNLFAPIYFYWDIGGWLLSGDEISFALPGVFFLSMIFWLPITFFLLIRYVKSSIIISKKLIKRPIGGKK